MLSQNESIGIENCTFISQILSNLRENKMDEFDNVFYNFRVHNAPLFDSILEQAQVGSYHR